MENINETLVDGIKYLIDQNDKSTKIYTGYITRANDDGTYTVTLNGKTYNLKAQNEFTLEPNTTAQIIVPQNNMSLAYLALNSFDISNSTGSIPSSRVDGLDSGLCYQISAKPVEEIVNTSAQGGNAGLITTGMGYFVTVGYNKRGYSMDGQNWNYTTVTDNISYTDLVFINDVFVAVGRTNTTPNVSKIIYSFNGITWSETTPPEPTVVNNFTKWNGITSGAVGSAFYWVITDCNGGLIYTTSTNLSSWTKVQLDLPFDNTSFAFGSPYYGNGTFIIPSNNNFIYVCKNKSPNVKSNWVAYDLTSADFRFSDKFCYGNGMFVGYNYNKFFTSKDGINWKSTISKLGVETNSNVKLICVENEFVITLYNSRITETLIFASEDGENWDSIGNLPSFGYTPVNFNNYTYFSKTLIGGSLYRIANYFEKVIKTYNGQSLDISQICYGSYIGTGTCPNSEENALLMFFDFPVKFFFVYAQRPITAINTLTTTMNTTTAYISCIYTPSIYGQAKSSSYSFVWKSSEDGTVLKRYSTNKNSSDYAYSLFNSTNTEYYYVAFG